MKVELFGIEALGGYDFERAENLLKEGAAADREGFGWINLPEADLAPCRAFAEQINGGPLGKEAPVVVVGIGGSALGLQTLLASLGRKSGPRPLQTERFFVADNVDSTSNADILARLPGDGRGVALVVVSKSGRTLETLSNFTWFVNRLGAYADWTDEGPRAFAVTDPQKGALRALVERSGMSALPLPPTVGGRFSVLSPAALPLAMAAGVDGEALLRGASRAKADLVSGGALADAARKITALVLDGLKKKRNITVFMPYGKLLGALAPWFCQLWGESLGKEGRGPTPQSAVGTVDQHSQLQLYAQGPDDKVFLFVTADREVEELPLHADSRWDLGLDYLEGTTLGMVQDNEFKGVLASLRQIGRPAVRLHLKGQDEEAFGEVFFFLEWLTALVGLVAGVNPFDQPGVEGGKNYALALCGDGKWQDWRDRAIGLIKPDLVFEE